MFKSCCSNKWPKKSVKAGLSFDICSVGNINISRKLDININFISWVQSPKAYYSTISLQKRCYCCLLFFYCTFTSNRWNLRISSICHIMRFTEFSFTCQFCLPCCATACPQLVVHFKQRRREFNAPRRDAQRDSCLSHLANDDISKCHCG